MLKLKPLTFHQRGNIMKQVLSVIALMLVAALAFGQTGGSAQNSATFNVGTPLTITPAAIPGDFGDLAPGTTYTITADGSIAPADVNGLTAVIPVEWTLAGQAGANVQISFALPAYFTSFTGARVPYTVNTQSAGWASTPFAPGAPYNPIDPRVENTVTLIGGFAEVQLGGILAVPVGADGAYSAQFILTAAYTGL
jgi:hypothetical protein